MAKPGLKIIKENNYKLNATGILFIEDDIIKMDISEDLDGSDVIEILPYLKELSDNLITLSLKKTEVIED